MWLQVIMRIPVLVFIYFKELGESVSEISRIAGIRLSNYMKPGWLFYSCFPTLGGGATNNRKHKRNYLQSQMRR